VGSRMITASEVSRSLKRQRWYRAQEPRCIFDSVAVSGEAAQRVGGTVPGSDEELGSSMSLMQMRAAGRAAWTESDGYRYRFDPDTG
jgi:hypothetical protein